MDVAVTQITSGVTAVTANGQSGLITTVSLTLAGATAGTFTVNNTATDADSVVLVGIVQLQRHNGIPDCAGEQLHCRHIIRHCGVECARISRAERDIEDRVSASVKKGTGRKPQCHPNRKHYAKGLCASCYHTSRKKKKTKNNRFG